MEDSTRSCSTVVWETGRVVRGDGAEGTSLGREIHKTWSWTNCWPRQQWEGPGEGRPENARGGCGQMAKGGASQGGTSPPF